MKNQIFMSIGIGIVAGVAGWLVATLLGLQTAMLPIVVGVASGVSAAMMRRKVPSS